MEVIGSKIVYIGPTVPIDGKIGSVWIQDTTGDRYICTSISPLTYTRIDIAGAAGAAIDVPYNAGNFSANGSMTWVVEAGDQLVFTYQMLGPTTMLVNVDLSNTTVGGTPNLTLMIKIPNSKSATKFVTQVPAIVYDNGVSQLGTAYTLLSDPTWINITRLPVINWTASTNNTHIMFQIIIEVV